MRTLDLAIEETRRARDRVDQLYRECPSQLIVDRQAISRAIGQIDYALSTLAWLRELNKPTPEQESL